MAKRLTASQLKSKIRQLEQKQKRAISDYNRAVNDYNRAVKKAMNAYNDVVRKHNSEVKRYRQLIKNELRVLNSSSAVQSSYTASSIRMHKHYEDVGRIYYEGIPVTHEQDRILDLIEQEQANSLITENFIEGDKNPECSLGDNEIGNMLALVSEDLNNRWRGAVYSLSPDNPDATRHFCTSTREIFTEFLEIKAPDKEVFAYNPQCEKTERGNATRREKIKYMMRNANMDDSVVSFVDEDIKNIIELNRLLSGGTHGPAGKFSFQKLQQVKKRVEQGISFLCEITAI